MPPSPHQLFDRHHPAVFRYLYRVSGRRDVAEDLTQDVFVRALRAAAAYRDEDRELPWLMRIARNRWIDHARAAAVRGTVVEVEERATGPQQLIHLGLTEALASLDPLDRDVFLLREVTGLGCSCSIRPAGRCYEVCDER